MALKKHWNDPPTITRTLHSSSKKHWCLRLQLGWKQIWRPLWENEAKLKQCPLQDQSWEIILTFAVTSILEGEFNKKGIKMETTLIANMSTKNNIYLDASDLSKLIFVQSLNFCRGACASKNIILQWESTTHIITPTTSASDTSLCRRSATFPLQSMLVLISSPKCKRGACRREPCCHPPFWTSLHDEGKIRKLFVDQSAK